ncbi:MAG: YbaB/EbfC family nucleoid-associated protein [Pseudomonadota bacterium]
MNINELMKQAQEMQNKMKGLQREIEDLVVTGKAGSKDMDMQVEVELNGRYNVVGRVKISDKLLKDKMLLGELIAAAFNDAVRKIETSTRGKMGDLTKGMQLPPDLMQQLGGNNSGSSDN